MVKKTTGNTKKTTGNTKKTTGNTKKTKVPMTKIKELVKRKKSFDTYVHQLIEDYNVSFGYIRGLLKEPLNESRSKK